MPEYLAPGVYVEETSFRAPSIEGVGTSTAAFVGLTATGPIPTSLVGPTPEPLTSFGDFTNVYGGYDNLSVAASSADPKNINYLALSVKAFFDNGGSRLYVQRVFTPRMGAVGGVATPDPGIAFSGPSSDTTVVVTARYPGGALNGATVVASLIASKTQKPSALPPGSLLVQLPAGGGAPIFFTNGLTSTFTNVSGGAALALPSPDNVYAMTLSVTAPNASGGTSVFEGLGFDANHPQYVGTVLGPVPPRRIDQLENQIAFHIGGTLTPATLFTAMFPGATLPADPNTTAPATFRLAGGNDGSEPAFNDYGVALATLESLENVSIVAAPGSSIFSTVPAGGSSSTADQVIGALIAHAERRRAYRIAILDTPPGFIASQVEDVRAKIDSSYAALYSPWVVMANPLARPGTSIPTEVTVPPSGFIAGIYARNDQQRGVAKAPANEVVLDGLRFERNINFAEQGILNPLGINCLRYFPGRGYRVWGARTASSNSEFKYVNVRRYLLYLEHSIDNGSQWAVFENSGPLLWARVKESIEEFLYSEFAGGNLLGSSPSEAYFVRCDRSTMTQNDLDNGRLICLIGVALLKPAEFVIFRIGQKTADARN